MADSAILGMDIGGSHLTAALVLDGTYSIIPSSYVRARVNSAGTAAEILDTWSNAILGIFESHKILDRRVGLAMPGPFDYENGISFIKGLNKYEALYQLNVKEHLARKIGIDISNVLMMNDAACFLLGEALGGAAKGYNNVIGITLGTGTGTASYHDGVAENLELGITPFKDSIVDDYFSTRWFINRYAELTGATAQNVQSISDQYSDNNIVRDIFAEFASNLADFLRELIRTEKPEVIVMGGNIAQCAHLFQQDIEDKLKQEGLKIPIVKAQHGEEAAIIGASKLFDIKRKTKIN